MRHLARLLAGAALALTLSVPGAVPARSQGADAAADVEPLFIDVTADPTPVWVHTNVRLTGQTMGGEGATTVGIVVTMPQIVDDKPAETRNLEAEVDSQGNYSVLFEETVMPGTYTVDVTAPDKRGTAKTEFMVIEPADTEEVVDVIEETARLAVEHADNVATQIENLPDSPAKDEMKQKLAEARAKLSDVVVRAHEIRDAMIALLELSAEHPEMAKPRQRVLESFNRLKQQAQRSKEELERLRRKVATCDSLEVVIEGLKWTSTMLDFFAGTVKDVALNFGKELLGFYASKAATAVGAPDALNFGATEAAKNIDSILQKSASIPTAVGVFTDLAVFASQKLMEKYCQVFSGPLKAHMKAEFYTGSIMWWSYEMDLTAVITLHYPKDAGAGSIPVRGRIEGHGHGFKMWENALTNLYPELMASAVQTKRIIPPIDAGPGINEKVGSLGSVAATVLPNSFFIAVEGTVDGDTLTVKLGPARTDMTPKATILAMILSPLVTFPVWTSYSLPYKDAHFVLLRATKGADMVFKIETEKDVMKAHETFSDKKDGGEAKAEYKLDIRLCNPGCGG